MQFPKIAASAETVVITNPPALLTGSGLNPATALPKPAPTAIHEQAFGEKFQPFDAVQAGNELPTPFASEIAA